MKHIGTIVLVHAVAALRPRRRRGRAGADSARVYLDNSRRDDLLAGGVKIVRDVDQGRLF
jgi:hypothetical protein